MKDIKSMMIGFLLATCMFLMMGADEISEWNVDGKVIVECNDNGRYQSFGTDGQNYLLDTTNGELWKHSKYDDVWVTEVSNFKE